ncbi:MAG: hypothetical protein J6386_08940 [Candidatus Synoicihabitans palmerolidicus]|nr:hypothetical protein [Candidatus Synoicihabitans palmerolidicus]
MVLGLASEAWAQAANVFSPKRRMPTVEKAVAFSARVLPEPLTEDLNNPFFPNRPEPEVAPVESDQTETPVAAPRGPRDNFELLETIAPEINPSGTMMLGGQPLLLFGQKKIRVGGELPIIYAGNRYTLVISAIESSFFTLRLGEAEYPRPIKSNN